MEENELQIISDEEIKDLIYIVRGKQVMLDSDVARLYKYETKNVNKAMKRNIERFPEDFCFQLTEEEKKVLRFQNGTLENQNGKGHYTKYLPYVYTEQGVAMLAGLLKNEIAVQVSIKIIRAFIEMRKFLALNGQIFERLTNVEYNLLKQDKRIDELFEKFDRNDVEKQKLFFDGQIWDSYNFIIIDNKELYHCGASLKDLGKKCFGINRIDDVDYIESLRKNVVL